MIFLTVGTSFPFDRLVKAVDEAVTQGKIGKEIFAQVGKGGYRPINFDSVEILDKNNFDSHFECAESVVAHAGIGTITMALELHKPILVVPRLKRYRELVNDHQLTTARRFEQLGHVLANYDLNVLPNKIQQLITFQPAIRTSRVADVANRIAVFLEQYLLA